MLRDTDNPLSVKLTSHYFMLQPLQPPRTARNGKLHESGSMYYLLQTTTMVLSSRRNHLL